MSITSKPKIIMQLLTALGLTQVDPYRMLIAGQIGVGGTATEKIAYKDCESKTDSELKTLFGVNSDLINRILLARSICKGQFAIWVVGISPLGTGNKATRDLAVTGTSASVSGKIKLELLSSYHFTTYVDVVAGALPAAVATAIKTAIDALPEYFPAVASIATATATLTASDEGLIPNKYTVKVSNVPAGLTISDGQFSGGTGAPADLDEIFDDVVETRFHSIQFPWDTDSDICADFLDSRLVINNAFLEGNAFIGIDGTEATLSALVNGTTPLNNPNLLFLSNRQVTSKSVIITPPDWRCIEFMAIEGLRRTEGAPISQYVLATARNDLYGGMHTCSLPYFNTPLAKTYVAKPEDVFNETEQENLMKDGISIIGVNSTRTSMIMGDVVTTYKFNSKGELDNSLKYKNFKDTAYSCLEVFFKTLKADNAQTRLTEGDPIPGYSMQNKKTIEAQYLSIYDRLSKVALTQAGNDAVKFFYENLNITLDLANNQVTSSGKLPIVTQLGKFNIDFQMAFSVGGEA